jgi:hypothetical protein
MLFGLFLLAENWVVSWGFLRKYRLVCLYVDNKYSKIRVNDGFIKKVEFFIKLIHKN